MTSKELRARRSPPTSSPTLAQERNRVVRAIPISQLDRGHAVREIRDQDLQGLSNSIGTMGVLEPALVSATGPAEHPFVLVAGYRRTRSAELAGLEAVPALVSQYTEREILEVQLIENEQREALDGISEAVLLKRYMEASELSQGDLERRLGLPQSSVSNKVRLLNLGAAAQDLIHRGKLGSSHGEVLLRIPKDARELEDGLAIRAADEELSVKALDNLVQFKIEEWRRSHPQAQDPPRATAAAGRKSGTGRRRKSKAGAWAERIFVVAVEFRFLAADAESAVAKAERCIDRNRVPSRELLSCRVGPAVVDWQRTAARAARKNAEEGEAPASKRPRAARMRGGGR